MVSKHVWLSIRSLVLSLSFGLTTVWGGQAPPSQGASSQSPALTLEEATRLALAHNQALRAQRLNIEQSRANEITAALKPNPVFTNVNEDLQIFSPGNLTLENLL